METAMKPSAITAKKGSALVTTVIMLAISTAIIGSIIHLAMSQSLIVRSNINRDRAFYLADAGLRCAITHLIDGGTETISQQKSRTFFENPSDINAGNWGFNTFTENVGGKTNRLVSVGRYNGIQQRVTIVCVDLSTNIVVSDFLKTAVYEAGEAHTLSLLPVDFINGPVHVQGDLDANGATLDRCEADKGDGENSVAGDARIGDGETWTEAGNPTVFEGPATQADFDAQKAWATANANVINGDDAYTPGEAFLDAGNGTRDPAEPYFKKSTDALAKAAAEAEAAKYPGATAKKIKNKEWYVDMGNGVYDQGEPFVDDRNGVYDRGVTAKGSVTGVAGTAGEGELPSDGYDEGISKPDLASMYYNLPKSDSSAPMGALPGWGHDIKVSSSSYGYADIGAGEAAKITNKNDPAHIFVMNPLTGSSKNGIPGRDYDPLVYPKTKDNNGNYIYGDKAGKRIADDFFLEDPTHSTYTGYDTGKAVTTDSTDKTGPKFIDVQASGNNKVYFVDGNLYIHSPNAYAMRFSEPGTKVTIIAKGNITVSDEFYYNGTYGGVTANGDNNNTGTRTIKYADINSTSIKDPKDTLCLIAMKDSGVDGVLGEGSTGNIYIGDAVYGTGGSIHAFLYAENDFIDNNLNSSDQRFISVYGCMAAGNEININRSGTQATRLDVTLDSRGDLIPGAPPPSKTDVLVIAPKSADWRIIRGSWRGSSSIPLPIFSPYDDGNNGHGNDPGDYDPSNPGKSKEP